VRLRLLSVGKPRSVRLAELHDDYARRIRRLGASYEAEHVAEVRPSGRFSEAHAREREAALLDERLGPRPGSVVALDREGDAFDSVELVARLGRWARPSLVLLVGGPSGLDPRLVARADVRWSLSPLTFPHEIVRVLVAEQIYRALTLSRGIPYHR
jgi:23S rRNA (pseudouridine1915-N3)-methyltransferase